jgi:hypothetical protein
VSTTIRRCLAVTSVSTTVVGLLSAGPGPARGAPTTVIRIELKELAFTPREGVIPVGKLVTLKVVNRGRMTHKFASLYLASRDLEVEGNEMDTFGRGLRWNERGREWPSTGGFTCG